jgi:hypothetical protein
MTAQAMSRGARRRRPLLPLMVLGIVAAGAASFVAYVLWPTWPRATTPLDAPAIPVTVAGVLFNVPPAAIRAAVQRHPGAHERIDLVFLWPSLAPPPAGGEPSTPAVANSDGEETPEVKIDDRVFVTIAGLGTGPGTGPGTVLAPQARLRSIYPRYIEREATAGADGLAVVAFRAGTPYEGEDLVYLAERPEQFFARCSRPAHAVPGTCIYERLLDTADATLRFPREWLPQWRAVAAGCDRLLAQIHSPNGRSADD